MAEYIERTLLMEWLTVADTQKRLRSSTGEEVYAEVLAMINNAPAADVVEVVRCEDCKFQHSCKRIVEMLPRQGQSGALQGRLHYCAYGIRKEDA